MLKSAVCQCRTLACFNVLDSVAVGVDFGGYDAEGLTLVGELRGG